MWIMPIGYECEGCRAGIWAFGNLNTTTSLPKSIFAFISFYPPRCAPSSVSIRVYPWFSCPMSVFIRGSVVPLLFRHALTGPHAAHGIPGPALGLDVLANPVIYSAADNDPGGLSKFFVSLLRRATVSRMES